MSGESPVHDDVLAPAGVADVADPLPQDPDFQRLHAQYLEYLQNEPVTKVKLPLYHGTGSYALRRILHDGFVPRSSSASLTGDSASSPWTPEEGSAFTSFAPGTSEGAVFARGYAYQSSREWGLSYTADEALGASFLERVQTKFFPDMNAAVEAEHKRVIGLGNNDPEDEVREAIKMEMDIQRERMQTPGAFVFSPDSAREMIGELQRLQNGEIEDTVAAERLLRANNVLWRRGASVVRQTLQTLSDPQSWLTKRIEELKASYAQMIIAYENLSDDERNELEHQFPCMVLVEGDGMKLGNKATAFVPEVQALERTEPQRVREISVPESKVETVQKWIEAEGLKGVIVTPLEFSEVKDVLDSVEKE
ncbi:MAG: hypothetical protein PHG63_00820 [Candidatus Dojkabacteria bacterium]|nr:hypothetical protein [Candidatus Dojkabacteria bacterium]